MKKIFPILLFLFIPKVLVSQNFREIKFETNFTNIVLVQKAIQNNIIFNKKEAKGIIDSLKVIDRKNLMHKIIGKWEYVSSRCEDCIPLKEDSSKPIKRYVVITKNKIDFYNHKIKRKNLTQQQKIKFTEQFTYFTDLTGVVFSDKTIWSLKTDKNKEYLMMYKTGNERKDDRTVITSGLSITYYKKIE
ncbi:MULTISPECIES: hypothetical protein [unclassified Tenacibaculum]|uniref:hypothetical protein n=1 Tax=unclassified Tenacibaculum TaxID=2635139 RepID=UPI001F15E38C|nr:MULTISPECIES: hypothetical protein [unclassified Tenacibaculum]MCF2875482.1 hypothetical protein [Tenacibaculum sp. Cn5-1]MCF2935558.1 hypothetical protein [Tenacibaculum sp. Cn5-34]MCG7512118.1 hypothetical protein [Tenacibaculum sp. Cn5-46]